MASMLILIDPNGAEVPGTVWVFPLKFDFFSGLGGHSLEGNTDSKQVWSCC
jgi:hypothetical protein